MIWVNLAWTALKLALNQILLSFLTSQVFKRLILISIKKLSEKTDNDLDDKIISIVEDAVYGRLPKDESENTCPKCRSVLN